ncbi:MAG: glucokinase, partial [Alphaproteobacteria bacterium]
MSPTGPSSRAPRGRRLRLLADVGGTKARFALSSKEHTHDRVEVYSNRDYVSLAAAARAYLDHIGAAPAPAEAAISIACPVDDDRISLTNFGWTFSREELRRELELDRLEVVNDFTAVALSVPHLGPGDAEKLGGGEPVPTAPVGVIGPGTGLGVSGLVPLAGRHVALSAEGGHVTLPASSAREDAVIARLRRRFGHVSAERAISGPGLVNLHTALREIDGLEAERLGPREIARRAVAASDPTCREAAAMLSAMLGTVAGNLALTLGAKGGVYLAGGVLHNMGAAFDRALFRERFESKGRLSTFT